MLRDHLLPRRKFMVIIMKKMNKGYFVHLQGYQFFSGRGETIAEAIGNLIMNHEHTFKLSIQWDKRDEITRRHIGK